MRAEDAIMAAWNAPLEEAERGVDDSLPEAIKTVRSSIARGETPATDALLIMFAAGVRYAPSQVEVTDEMVDRASLVIASETKIPLPDDPTILQYIADAQRELARLMLTAALRPAAHPPTDGGAEASS